MPGPPPKRAGNRLGSARRVAQARVSKSQSGGGKNIPQPDPNWSPVVIAYFNSFKTSGQSQYYEDSDWHTLYAAAELYDDYMVYRRATLIAEFIRLNSELLATEGARRRTRIELEKNLGDADADSAVSSLDSWRKKLA